jgi:hypothetical protein
MHKRVTSIGIIAILMFSILTPCIMQFSNASENNNTPGWNDYKYRQEIILPINTSSEHAKYQPIDIQINLNNT